MKPPLYSYKNYQKRIFIKSRPRQTTSHLYSASSPATPTLVMGDFNRIGTQPEETRLEPCCTTVGRQRIPPSTRQRPPTAEMTQKAIVEYRLSISAWQMTKFCTWMLHVTWRSYLWDQTIFLLSHPMDRVNEANYEKDVSGLRRTGLQTTRSKFSSTNAP
jgi:hypothetical protein